mmetsp:Transcript_13920/g.31098  ORF Transcript_13920/g.31098 Transcript_13920/m.31098 type:complete len:325 (+) Transcript_13920:1555-2529(+)
MRRVSTSGEPSMALLLAPTSCRLWRPSSESSNEARGRRSPAVSPLAAPLMPMTPCLLGVLIWANVSSHKSSMTSERIDARLGLGPPVAAVCGRGGLPPGRGCNGAGGGCVTTPTRAGRGADLLRTLDADDGVGSRSPDFVPRAAATPAVAAWLFWGCSLPPRVGSRAVAGRRWHGAHAIFPSGWRRPAGLNLKGPFESPAPTPAPAPPREEASVARGGGAPGREDASTTLRPGPQPTSLPASSRIGADPRRPKEAMVNSSTISVGPRERLDCGSGDTARGPGFGGGGVKVPETASTGAPGIGPVAGAPLLRHCSKRSISLRRSW